MILAALTASVAAAIVPAGFAAAAAYASHTRDCGSYTARGELYTRLRANGATCKTARAVVRGWSRTDSTITGWRRLARPAGWRCRYVPNPVRFSCMDGTSRVRFDPGPGF